MIVYLTIPFDELPEAKMLGAQYDIHKKMWYVKDHTSMSQIHTDPEQHPFIILFGKWFANQMKKTKRVRPKRNKHIVIQPRTPRKVNNKRRR
jgi:hypothetical protein